MWNTSLCGIQVRYKYLTFIVLFSRCVFNLKVKFVLPASDVPFLPFLLLVHSLDQHKKILLQVTLKANSLERIAAKPWRQPTLLLVTFIEIVIVSHFYYRFRCHDRTLKKTWMGDNEFQQIIRGIWSVSVALKRATLRFCFRFVQNALFYCPVNFIDDNVNSSRITSYCYWKKAVVNVSLSFF